MSDSLELLKPISGVAGVTDTKLQIELGNLKAENRNLRQKLADSRDTIETLNWGTEALNEQLATANQTITERDDSIESLKLELAENTRYYVARLNEAGATIGSFKDKLEAVQAKKQRLQNDLGNLQAEVIVLREQVETERASREKIEGELFDLKQKSAAANELPEAADLYNQLKAKRKKSSVSLADVETLLEMMGR